MHTRDAKRIVQFLCQFSTKAFAMDDNHCAAIVHFTQSPFVGIGAPFSVLAVKIYLICSTRNVVNVMS